MAFPTKDGSKKFGSRFAQRKYDQHHGAAPAAPAKPAAEPKMNAMHEAKETPEFEAGEQEGAQEGPEQNEAPEQVVANHGKALSTNVHSDHANKKHHVVSHHADGHVHNSDHASKQEADATVQKLMGEESQAQTPENSGMEGVEADGFHMPHLA